MLFVRLKMALITIFVILTIELLLKYIEIRKMTKLVKVNDITNFVW